MRRKNGVVHVAIIPHTDRDQLRTLKPGDPVNIEADILLKFTGSRDGSAIRRK